MRLPSHTTVVAYLALFAAVATGGAYAISVERNSIKSQHLAGDAIKRKHIAENAVGAEELAKTPFGMMERNKPGNIISDPFIDSPVTYDSLGDGAFPGNSFNLARGVFVVPVSGSYVLTGQVNWVDPNGIGRDMRFVTLNDDGSPRSVLISALAGPGGDHIQPINGTVRLKEGDVVQLTVANGGDNGDFTYAQMNITFVSG